MNTRIPKLVAAGFILLVTSAEVLAQGPGPPMLPGGMGGPGDSGGPSLVGFAAVQKELGLTDKQSAQIKRLDSTMSRQRETASAEGGFDPETMRSPMNTLRRRYETSVNKVLTKTQKERLSELELQREGLMAVARKDVSSKPRADLLPVEHSEDDPRRDAPSRSERSARTSRRTSRARRPNGAWMTGKPRAKANGWCRRLSPTQSSSLSTGWTIPFLLFKP